MWVMNLLLVAFCRASGVRLGVTAASARLGALRSGRTASMKAASPPPRMARRPMGGMAGAFQRGIGHRDEGRRAGWSGQCWLAPGPEPDGYGTGEGEPKRSENQAGPGLPSPSGPAAGRRAHGLAISQSRRGVLGGAAVDRD